MKMRYQSDKTKAKGETPKEVLSHLETLLFDSSDLGKQLVRKLAEEYQY